MKLNVQIFKNNTKRYSLLNVETNMKKLNSYTNKYGHIFDLSVEKSDVSDLEKECWGFIFLVTHKEWDKITMRGGIKKTFIKDESTADKFIEEKVLEKVKYHLDGVDDKKKFPLFTDESDKGWFIV